MKKVFKFTLFLVDKQFVTMPKGAKILTIQPQGRSIQLWALVDESQPMIGRKIECYGTGHTIEDPNGLIYIASIQTHADSFIWHFFERS